MYSGLLGCSSLEFYVESIIIITKLCLPQLFEVSYPSIFLPKFCTSLPSLSDLRPWFPLAVGEDFMNQCQRPASLLLGTVSNALFSLSTVHKLFLLFPCKATWVLCAFEQTMEDHQSSFCCTCSHCPFVSRSTLPTVDDKHQIFLFTSRYSTRNRNLTSRIKLMKSMLLNWRRLTWGIWFPFKDFNSIKSKLN